MIGRIEVFKTSVVGGIAEAELVEVSLVLVDGYPFGLGRYRYIVRLLDFLGDRVEEGLGEPGTTVVDDVKATGNDLLVL